MDRAIILGEGRHLEIAKALGLVSTVPNMGPKQSLVGPANALARSADFPSLDTVIEGHVRLALEQSDGRIEGPRGAAALLRINPHTLRARMRRLGIEWGSYRTKNDP